MSAANSTILKRMTKGVAMLFDLLTFSISSVALAVSALALRAAQGKESRTQALGRVCSVAVGYAEKVGSTSEEKLKHAIEAARLLDSEDGKRDFTDAELRVGVEAALAGLQRG